MARVKLENRNNAYSSSRRLEFWVPSDGGHFSMGRPLGSFVALLFTFCSFTAQDSRSSEKKF